MIGAFWPEMLEIIGASDVFVKPGQGEILKLYGVIPVRRGEYDRALLKRIVSIIKTGYPFLIMEISEGVVGKELSQDTPMTEEETLEIIQCCVNGLIYLHERGCIHRDVKPDNILHFPDTYKLGDLGIVKWTDFDEAITKGGTLTRQSMQLGSWFYMAPEQQQSPHEAVAASDIYALGISWIEMATGMLYAPHAVGAKAYNLPILSKPINGIIEAMLSYNPKDRPSLEEINSFIKS